MTPLVLLCGQAGVGKDVLADRLVANHGAVALGQADPIKWLARDLFGFSDATLFGPSSARNEFQQQFALPGALDMTFTALGRNMAAEKWCNQWFTRYQLATDALYALRSDWMPTVAERIKTTGGLTARWVLQTLGTEWGRNLHSEVWIDEADLAAFRVLTGNYAYDRRTGLYARPEGTKRVTMGVITDGRFRNEILGIRRRGGQSILIERRDRSRLDVIGSAGVAGHASEAELDTIPDHFYDGIAVNDGEESDLDRLASQIAQRVQEAPWKVYAQNRR